VGRLDGPRGLPQRGPCPVCALKQDAFSFGFLQVLSGISPVVLGDPQGCPRQFTKKQRGKNRGKPSQLASLLAGGALGEEMGQARCVPV
jgi:hypothetical protein